MNNLYSAFQKTIIQNAQKIFIQTTKGNFSFSDIEIFSAKIANALSAMGLQAGDRIAVQVEKSAYNIFLYLACLRAGLIYLPLNNSYTDDELSFFFKDANPRLIICDPVKEVALRQITNIHLETLNQEGQGSLASAWQNQAEKHHIFPSAGEDVAVMLYTSGTTGKPKGAMLSHRALLSNAMTLNQVWQITAQDVFLHMLPLFHVHGLFFGLHTLLLAGGKIVLASKFDTDTFFTRLPEVSLFMGVPTYYTRLLNDERLTKASCAHMRLFTSGSAPLLPTTFEAFQARTGHTLLERYGMTETGVNTSNPLQGKRKVGSVGLPLPGIDVQIAEAKRSGDIGEIQIRGENLFSGYWEKKLLCSTPQKNANATNPYDRPYFHTGDLGYFDEDGYLFIVGRSKDLIITGGLNVYPKEIELSLNALDGIEESAVIGIPHPDFGEAVIAVVVGDASKLNEKTLIDNLKQHHAGYKCPKRIFFTDALPKNTMGKVQKNILRKQFEQCFK
ncbi:MAG: AMP-binding protein [Gammaproteobacteria bacterium]|jgi:malonyl-CoA/methylmalonyl-CoA synthetase|nr:AMP-binding protein [Gammaproteobacteria bacterium]